jgi:glycosyltransferase involved in cell wall biosynthesis
MADQLKILNVETGIAPDEAYESTFWSRVIDYQFYNHRLPWLRKIEEKLRMDFGLAFEARKLSKNYDVIWASSEKVGVPLALIGIRKPIIVVCHHLSSPLRRRLVSILKIAQKWAGIGYVSPAEKEFIICEFNVPEDRFIQCCTAPLSRYKTDIYDESGPIISLGVAKRDYPTLISALKCLPGYETEIYVSSQYGDLYGQSLDEDFPYWIHWMKKVTHEEITKKYESCRFVVLPLISSDHFSAGTTVALEAASAGKAIIATATQGLQGFIIHGETGILVPPGNVPALTEAIESLWNNPELAYQLGQNARMYIEECLDPEKIGLGIQEGVQRAWCNFKTKRAENI